MGGHCTRILLAQVSLAYMVMFCQANLEFRPSGLVLSVLAIGLPRPRNVWKKSIRNVVYEIHSLILFRRGANSMQIHHGYLNLPSPPKKGGYSRRQKRVLLFQKMKLVQILICRLHLKGNLSTAL